MTSIAPPASPLPVTNASRRPAPPREVAVAGGIGRGLQQRIEALSRRAADDPALLRLVAAIEQSRQAAAEQRRRGRSS